MIWLVWRRHRKQALFALLGLAALAAFMVPTGMQMHDAFERAGLDDCLRAAARVEFVRVNPAPDQPPDPGPLLPGAGRAVRQPLREPRRGRHPAVVPAAVGGAVLGAPLVAREVEHGTHRLVWTQGISRRRWALAKFGLVGGAWCWQPPATRCW